MQSANNLKAQSGPATSDEGVSLKSVVALTRDVKATAASKNLRDSENYEQSANACLERHDRGSASWRTGPWVFCRCQ